MSVNEVIREVNKLSLTNFLNGSYKYVNSKAEEDGYKNNVELYTTEELVEILSSAGFNIPKRGLGPRMYRQVLINKAAAMMQQQVKVNSYPNVRIKDDYKDHLRNSMFIQTAESMANDDI